MFLQVAVCQQGLGMRGRGACGGGMHGRGGMYGRGAAYMAGGHACHTSPPADTTRYGDTVNEWAVRIILECILLQNMFPLTQNWIRIVRAFINTRLLIHKHVKISVDKWILETTHPQKHVKYLEQIYVC